MHQLTWIILYRSWGGCSCCCSHWKKYAQTRYKL